MTINNTTVEQINVALLDIDKRIKALNTDSETIKSLQNSIKAIKSSLKSPLNETTIGMAKDLTVNGKIYNGSEAVNAGVQTVENGGTDATTAKDAFMNLANGLSDDVNPVDTEHIIFKSTSGTNWGLYKLSTFWGYIKGKISSVLGLTRDNYGGKASTAGTADKAVGVVDYNGTSRTVRIGYNGPGVTADKLSYLAGYTEADGSSVKLKDVNREEVIKWLGLPIIKYADYRTENLTFDSETDQKKIELSNFGSNVTEDKVLSFMVIYWTGVPITASGDWAKSQGLGTEGLACALHALRAGTGRCVIRCVYVVF